MDFTLNVTISLSQGTIELLNGFLTKVPTESKQAPAAAAPAKPAHVPAPAPAPAPAAAAPAKPAAKPAAGKAAFEDLDADAQLEAIKTEVTRHTKKGKSADIKALLAFFNVARASELAEEQYQDFFDVVVRYGKGESVEDLTSSDLD